MVGQDDYDGDSDEIPVNLILGDIYMYTVKLMMADCAVK